MLKYFLRRLLALAFVAIGITLLTFTVSHIVPADPAVAAAGQNATKEQVAAIRAELQLDRPLPLQYLSYLSGLVRGDLGRSTQSRRPILADIQTFFPATVELTFVTMALYTLIGVPLGVLAALRRGWIDRLTNALTIGGVSIPPFWLALVFQLVFYATLGWLPSGNRIDQGLEPPRTITSLYTIDSLLTGNWVVFESTLRHLILPATTLVIGRLGPITRITRASIRDTLTKEYVRTARAKGLAHSTVLTRHVIRNSLIPIVTIIGLQTGWLLNGAVVIEVIFGWPGVGQYAVNAIAYADFPAVMGVTLVVALLFVCINFVVDLTYRFLDPRITV
ncbi:MAG: ABC transporter permease [Chloroflexi bacterium]|nr:ABC transporter permease [Chloroflexota bacterium]